MGTEPARPWARPAPRSQIAAWRIIRGHRFNPGGGIDEFIGECEICGRGPRGLRVVGICGLDTFACHECLGDDPDAEIDDALEFESLVETMR
jgi:hypothetical protein